MLPVAPWHHCPVNGRFYPRLGSPPEQSLAEGVYAGILGTDLGKGLATASTTGKEEKPLQGAFWTYSP